MPVFVYASAYVCVGDLVECMLSAAALQGSHSPLLTSTAGQFDRIEERGRLTARAVKPCLCITQKSPTESDTKKIIRLDCSSLKIDSITCNLKSKTLTQRIAYSCKINHLYTCIDLFKLMVMIK